MFLFCFVSKVVVLFFMCESGSGVLLLSMLLVLPLLLWRDSIKGRKKDMLFFFSFDSDCYVCCLVLLE